MKGIKHLLIGLLVMFLIAPALDLTPCAAENAPDGKSPQVNERSSKMVYNETMKETGRQQAKGNAKPAADNLVNTYYIYSYDGKLLCEYDHNGNCVKDYIYIGNRLFAEYHPQTDKYYYYTIDQVNSTRVITDDNGNVVYSAAHGPYGQIQKTWTNTYDPGLKFSGKEREGYSHLDYFGARYYDHRSYRFTSPDPVFNRAALSNPQLWNLYSYCRNNPITYFDPNGRQSQNYFGMFWIQHKIIQECGEDGIRTVQNVNHVIGLGAFAMSAGIAGYFAGPELLAAAMASGSAIWDKLIRRPDIIGNNIQNIRIIASGRLKGFLRFNTTLKGGSDSAVKLFNKLTGSSPTGEFVRKVLKGGKEIIYRSAGKSGHPKIEVINRAKKTYEKISFTE